MAAAPTGCFVSCLWFSYRCWRISSCNPPFRWSLTSVLHKTRLSVSFPGRRAGPTLGSQVSALSPARTPCILRRGPESLHSPLGGKGRVSARARLLPPCRDGVPVSRDWPAGGPQPRALLPFLWCPLALPRSLGLLWVGDAVTLPPQSSSTVALPGRISDRFLDPLPEKCCLLIYLKCIDPRQTWHITALSAQMSVRHLQHCAPAKPIRCRVYAPANQMQGLCPSCSDAGNSPGLGTFSLARLFFSFSYSHFLC